MHIRKTSAVALLALAWVGGSATGAFAEDAPADDVVAIEAPVDGGDTAVYSLEDTNGEQPVDEATDAATDDSAADDASLAEAGVPAENQRSVDAPLMATTTAAGSEESDSSNPALPVAAGAIALAAAGAFVVKRRSSKSE